MATTLIFMWLLCPEHQHLIGQGGEIRLQWNIEAFSHFKTDYLKNAFVQYQLHDEGPDEAHHAGPGVPDLRGLGEPQERLTQLGLRPWHLDSGRKLRCPDSESRRSR